MVSCYTSPCKEKLPQLKFPVLFCNILHSTLRRACPYKRILLLIFFGTEQTVVVLLKEYDWSMWHIDSRFKICCYCCCCSLCFFSNIFFQFSFEIQDSVFYDLPSNSGYLSFCNQAGWLTINKIFTIQFVTAT